MYGGRSDELLLELEHRNIRNGYVGGKQLFFGVRNLFFPTVFFGQFVELGGANGTIQKNFSMRI